MPKGRMVIVEVTQRSLNPFMVTVHDPGGVGARQMVSKLTRDRLRQWMGSPWAVIQPGKDTWCRPLVKRTRKLVS